MVGPPVRTDRNRPEQFRKAPLLLLHSRAANLALFARKKGRIWRQPFDSLLWYKVDSSGEFVQLAGHLGQLSRFPIFDENIMFGLDYAAFAAFAQVVMIDLVLAADNAIVIGLAAAGLAPELRRKAILIGILAATVLRIFFAIIATELMQIIGLILIGGILLLWVSWKMYRELTVKQEDIADAEEALSDQDENKDGKIAGQAGNKTLKDAVFQIIVADVSMSLDNVLAVAGAAREHPTALIFGLGLSVVLMGAASAAIAKLLHRFRWIAWIGLLVILYVAIRMIYEGADQVLGHTLPNIPLLKSGMPAAH
jgi:YjbE family integral membrane protein